MGFPNFATALAYSLPIGIGLAAIGSGIGLGLTGKGGLKGAARFAGLTSTPLVSGVPLLDGVLAAIDCELEHVVERHSHAIVIGRVLDIQLSPRSAALAYWQGQYLAIDRDEDAIRLADVSVPARQLRR